MKLNPRSGLLAVAANQFSFTSEGCAFLGVTGLADRGTNERILGDLDQNVVRHIF